MNFNFGAVSEKSLFHLIGFGHKNVKINFFEEKGIFSTGFIKLIYMW